MRNTYKILGERPEDKLFGRYGSNYDNIKIYLKETGCECVEWIQMAQDTLQWWVTVNTAMNLRVP
jgi:hypothetical protein